MALLGSVMKLLLHACCAPCSIQCVESLVAEGIKPDLFWYNPNIHPCTEYHSRLDALCIFAEDKKLPLVIEDAPCINSVVKNCALCYRRRLKKAASLALEKGFDAFSTTLLISPYQNHELIRQTGEELAAAHGIEFLYRDFRPRFRKGQNQARQAGYYMQKYCGCIHSEEERSLARRGGK